MSLIAFVMAFGAFIHRHDGIWSVHTSLSCALSGDVGVKYGCIGNAHAMRAL